MRTEPAGKPRKRNVPWEKRNRKIFKIGICWLCAAGVGFAQSLNPTGNIAIHDPSSLIKAGGTYYVFQTGNLIPFKTSPDVVHWSNAGSVFSSPPAWQVASVPNGSPGDMWAPDISFRNGIYWLYYAVSSSGSQTSAIGLATRTSLSSGSWQDQSVVLTSPLAAAGNFNAIDPNIITDTQGNVWMAWGSWWNGIYITQLNPLTGKPSDPLTTSNTTNIANRGGKGIEAAFITYARSYYFLFTSWDVCCEGTSSTYNMRFGRSQNVTGPYVDKSGVQLVAGGGTLLSDGSGFPGGGQSVYQENGSYYLVYHVYDGRNNPASLQIRHLYFDSQVWPTFDASAAVALRRNASAPRVAVRINPMFPTEIRFHRPGNNALFDLAGREEIPSNN